MTDKPLAELGKRFHETAVAHGWWEKERNFGEIIALFHSEVSEAFEEYRAGHEMTEVYYEIYGDKNYPYSPNVPQYNEAGKMRKPEGIPVELADILIRVLETCYKYGIDIDAVVALKAAYNDTRPYKHGGKRA